MISLARRPASGGRKRQRTTDNGAERPWKLAELRRVARDYRRDRVELLAARHERRPEEIAAVARLLGITRRLLTPTDRDLLEQQYGWLPAAEIGRRLELTTTQVHQAAARMGLATSTPRPRGWERTLRRMHAQGRLDSEIAAKLRVDRRLLQAWRSELGLPSNAVRSNPVYRAAMRRAVANELKTLGLSSPTELRSRAYRLFARRHGWPEDCQPRMVQLLDALHRLGPLTRKQLCGAIGMPWKGSRKSLCGKYEGGSYLATLQRRGLVVRLGRLVKGRRKGESCNLYALAPGVAPAIEANAIEAKEQTA